jgi:hypothetical protein
VIGLPQYFSDAYIFFRILAVFWQCERKRGQRSHFWMAVPNRVSDIQPI